MEVKRNRFHARFAASSAPAESMVCLTLRCTDLLRLVSPAFALGRTQTLGRI